MSTSPSATSDSYEGCACAMSKRAAKASADSWLRDPTATRSRPAVRRSDAKAAAMPPVARIPQRRPVMVSSVSVGGPSSAGGDQRALRYEWEDLLRDPLQFLVQRRRL